MDIAQDIFFAHQALAALFSVTNKLQMKGDKFLGDISVRQMLAVPAIVHAPDGKATINSIARHLGTSKQSAKQIVDALEKKKYIAVAPSKRDKRALDLTITTRGKRAFRECSQRTDEFLANIFNDFSTEDMETLWTLLKKLYCFDGAGQDVFEMPIQNHEGSPDAIMRHHQNYLKKRINKNE